MEENIVSINFTALNVDSQAVVILVDDSLQQVSEMNNLNQQHQELISKVLADKTSFSGKFGQTQVLTFADNTSNQENKLKYLIIVGIGSLKKLKSSRAESIGGKIHNIACCNKISSISISTRDVNGITTNHIAALIASGALLASYKFDKYLTKQKEEDKFTLTDITIITSDPETAEKLFIEKKAVVLGVFLARNCINEPGNILYPESYANIIFEALDPIGVDVNILGEREMRTLGMGALLGVGQGSQNESKLVVMKYMGAGDNNITPIALVGKGVTFDTGGISLKPSNNMGDMKYDMAGSAAVVGTIKALALRNAKVNVVGVVGLVENMPGGNAQRPGDVVKTMSGQTVEVLDTDAEGRLVLADAVWYAQEEFKPSHLIDLATLTGAIVVSLGKTYAGLFANDETLAKNLLESGDEVDEKLWQMPLHRDYDDMIKSNIADVANLGCEKGKAGSSTAAQFIGRFIKEETKWAHLDIAGVAWQGIATNICPKGAVGFGVRLLNQFIWASYEPK